MLKKLLISIFIATSSCLSVPAKLFQSEGIANFDTSPYFGTNISIINNATFRATFAYAASDNYRPLSSIQQIDKGSISANTLAFRLTIYDSKPTYLQYGFTSYDGEKLSKLAVRYLLLYSSFTSSLVNTYSLTLFISLKKDNTHTRQVSTSDIKDYTTGNFTGNLINVYFIQEITAGIQAGTGPNGFGFQFSLSRTNGSIKTTYFNRGQYSIGIFSITFCLLTVNVGELTAASRKITYGTINGTSGQLLYSDVGKRIKQQNAIVGITGFQLTNAFAYSFKITPQTSISMTAPNPYKYFQFMYFIFEGPNCTAPTPYFMASDKLCYDVCPNGFVGNTATLLCEVSASTNNTQNNGSTPANNTATSESSNKGSVIFGIVFGSIVFLIIVLVILFKMCIYTKNKNLQAVQPQANVTTKGQLQVAPSNGQLQVTPSNLKGSSQLQTANLGGTQGFINFQVQ